MTHVPDQIFKSFLEAQTKRQSLDPSLKIAHVPDQSFKSSLESHTQKRHREKLLVGLGPSFVGPG
jgi:hypothetical protein